MKYRLTITSLTALALTAVAAATAAAAPSERISVKIGYLRVRPDMVPDGFYDWSKEGIALTRYIETSKKRIHEALAQHTSKEEVEAIELEVRTTKELKWQNLIRLTSAYGESRKAPYLEPSKTIAKERGLDIIIDRNGIFVGEEAVLQSGEDVLKPMQNLLGPNFK